MMKKVYEKSIIKVIPIKVEDIVTTSQGFDGKEQEITPPTDKFI